MVKLQYFCFSLTVALTGLQLKAKLKTCVKNDVMPSCFVSALAVFPDKCMRMKL